METGTVPQRISPTANHQFTMLPFTSGSGEAVCCVMIVQSETGEVPSLWRQGQDKLVDLIRDADGNVTLEANMSEGKAYQGGPACKYSGKLVPCLTYASKSGGITGEILVQILKEFDTLDLFSHVNGNIPVIVINGH